MIKPVLAALIAFSPFQVSEKKRETLLSSLNPTSLTEHIAFYELYGSTKQGRIAQERILALINKHRTEKTSLPGKLRLPDLDIFLLIEMVNRGPSSKPAELSEQELSDLEACSAHLAHHNLKGHTLWDLKSFEKLESAEIDLARALLLCEYPGDKMAVRRYEAALDLMALQILAKLDKNATDKEKIRAISDFIFHEMGFRFPPHSLYAKDIDLYTFLPSVIDNRKGVCLGVSILYLTLAQRLDLDLTIITPPGHIFLKHGSLNIETTARGIHIDDEHYLSINTYKLYERNMKEVIGMAFVNQASLAWQSGKMEKAVELYEKAEPFCPDDPLFKMLLGLSYLIDGQNQKGRAYLQEIAGKPFPDAVIANSMPTDILSGRADAESVSVIFSAVDETKKSIIDKQKALRKVIAKFPKFKAARFHLAVTYLQLGRYGEAMDALRDLHAIGADDPEVEYYLAALCLERYEYKSAWKHLGVAQKLLEPKNHRPKALFHLQQHLKMTYPLDGNSNTEY